MSGACRDVNEISTLVIKQIVDSERAKAGGEVHLFVYIYINSGAIEYIPNTVVKNTIVLLKYYPFLKKTIVDYWILPNETSNISELEKSLEQATKTNFSYYKRAQIVIDDMSVSKIFNPDFEDQIFKYTEPQYGFVGQGPVTWYGIFVGNKLATGRGERLPEDLDLIIRPTLEAVLQKIWKQQGTAAIQR
jgi:hypothetical protein